MSETGGVFDAGAAVGTLGLDTSGFVRGLMTAEGLMQMFPSWVTNFMANPLLGFVGILQDSARAIAAWVGQIAELDDAADELA
ncbi:MAG: hypothetical protein ACM359_07060, partial [Bacillota bacterium]